MKSTKSHNKSEEHRRRAWREWQEQHAAKRRALGYDKLVSDDEALAVLGLS